MFYVKQFMKYEFKEYEKEVDNKLEHIVNVVKRSEKILDLKDNWDDEGSRGYDFDTWVKMIDFVFLFSEFLLKYKNKQISTLKIYPSIDKSFDIVFEGDNLDLVVNFSNIGDYATYYNEVTGNEGEIQKDMFQFLNQF